jgi:hypothetical protein
MNSKGDGKHEPADPENAVRLLELELMRQRVERQQAGSPYRALRVVSFIFLFAVIVGAMLAFYYVFYSGGLDEFRARNEPKTIPTATPFAKAP